MALSVKSGAGVPPAPSATHLVFEAEEWVLSNGLCVLLMEDHAAPVISYQVHYAAGSRDERPGITGMASVPASPAWPTSSST